jgi:high-affinity nickel-transport protein
MARIGILPEVCNHPQLRKRREITMTITAPASLQLALLSAAILGFRHGFDYDHIAAISDITSVPSSKRQAMRLGLLYARVAERLVGATLIVLGIYVLGLLFKGDHVPRSRFALLAKLAAWLHWKVQKHWHSHDLPAPETPHWNYTAKSVFLIGVVHGLGAETPSQLAIFLLAAMGGVGKGFLGLAMFLAGLLAMNTLMTASAAGLFGFSARMPRLQFTITALTAVYSLTVGSVFLLGYSTSLIPLVR